MLTLPIPFRGIFTTMVLACVTLVLSTVVECRGEEPSLQDPQKRFEITLFADHSLAPNPIGIQVDERGWIYVISNHTHFRPADYEGPSADQILRMRDEDGDSVADQVQVYFEGLQFATDMALNPDGTLYVSTRSEIYSLRDTDNDRKADETKEVVRLKSKVNYPHNGISGLSFDGHGGMYFGLGENLGGAYELFGSDQVRLSGGGEGGGVFHCRLDGSQLRRIGTGIWNPFGICVVESGQVFAVDNDPHSLPPCRLLHIVEGGDYGFEYRYGRSGLHPFQCWNGELPGTLPMAAAVGEAPCEIVPYDAGLLVASWADNRLEHYRLVPRGTSYSAEQTVLIAGDMNFRPVGIGAAQDGTLYVTDWSTASYSITGKGRIWKLKPKSPPAILKLDVATFDEAEKSSRSENSNAILAQLDSDDPFVRSATIHRLSSNLEMLEQCSIAKTLSSRQRLNVLIAQKKSNAIEQESHLLDYLQDPDGEIRLAALKWISDKRLVQYRRQVEAELDAPDLTRELLEGYLVTLEMLDRGSIKLPQPDPKRLIRYVLEQHRSPRLRAFALQLIPPDDAHLSIKLLRSLLRNSDENLRLEAVRTASAAPNAERWKLLAEVVDDERQPISIRSQAVEGLADATDCRSKLITLALADEPSLRDAAFRSLVGMTLDGADRERLRTLKDLPEAARVLQLSPSPAPPKDDLQAWLQWIEGESDPENGRRVFFHAKIGGCARCHRMQGRGNHVGPELTYIGRRATPEWLLTALLQPSRDVSPGFRQWLIATKDGRQFTGLALRKGDEREEYVSTDGKPFWLTLDEIESRHELNNSIMPDGVVDHLTRKELRDLIGYLLKQR